MQPERKKAAAERHAYNKRFSLNRLLTDFVLPMMLCIVGNACSSRNAMSDLHHAEEIIEEYPDSAYNILLGIDRGSLGSPVATAKYALLMTQAQDIKKIPATSDSLIDIALDYYKNRDEYYYLMKSWFFKGRLRYNAGDWDASMSATMESYGLTKRYSDDYWRAKSAELIADNYSETYYNQGVIPYTIETADCYLRAGKVRNHRFALCDLATAYSNVGETTKSIAILDSICSIAHESPTDTLLMVYCYRSLFPISARAGLFDKASSYADSLRALSGYYSFTVDDYTSLAKLYLDRKDFLQAESLLNIADSLAETLTEKVDVYNNFHILYKSKGEYKEALRYLDSVINLQDVEVENVLRQSVIASQRDYYDAEAQAEHRASYLLRLILILVFAIALLLAVAGIMIYRVRIRAKNAEIDRKVDDIIILSESLINQKNTIDNLLETIENKDSDIGNLKTQLSEREVFLSAKMEELFRDKWSTLNKLCNEYFEKGNSDKARISILNDIERDLTRMRSNKSMDEIESAVNLYMGDIMKQLRRQCPFLKPQDFTFIMLIYAGFAPRAVCMFTELKLKYYYNKRYRLSERILKSDAPERELFVNKLKP